MTKIKVKTSNDLSRHVGQSNSKFLRTGHGKNVAEPFYMDGNTQFFFMSNQDNQFFFKKNYCHGNFQAKTNFVHGKKWQLNLQKELYLFFF